MEPAPDPRGPVANVLSRLHKAKRASGGWVAQCPAHEDRNPSLSIGEGNDGRVLLNCHAGCTVQAIVSALGITEADLFPPKDDQPTKLVETAVYRYEDETGQHLYDVVRFHPKTFRQRRPNGEWGLKDTRRVIYRLPQVRAAIDQGETIYIAEGEKDVHAIEKAGGTATCNPMGAGKWHDNYTRQLDGATQVVIVADNDEPGHAHANSVAQSLERASIPHRIVLPAAGKDAADHLSAGNTLDELVPLLATAIVKAITVVPLEQFVSVTEDVAEPLVGTPDDSLLPADGLLLMYGDGGAGKTTLSLDALAHLASGTPWLGLQVNRPLRILLIENEGPRGPFRQRLNTKIQTWQGAPFQHNVYVLEDPWTRFTITDDTYRAALSEAIDEHHIDLVIVGPLASLGAKGTGTPDEINEFDNHVQQLRAGASRQFALWIVHHENKAGDVSGAWERYPDTLVHIQAQGNGRTRVVWRKVRWSSELHGTSVNLVWAEGNGFQVEDQKTRDLHVELLQAFALDDRWMTAKEAATLIKANVDKVRDALGELVESGQFKYEQGPLGRTVNAKCWRLNTDSEAPSQSESVTPLEGFAHPTDSLTPPMKESESESVGSEPDESDSSDPSQWSQVSTDDDEIQRLLDTYLPDTDQHDDGIPW